jgi:multidrug efflux pump subunit AcrB
MTDFLTTLLSRRVMANILMGLFIFGGLISALNIRQEFLPAREARAVEVHVELIGAQPKEIETSILIPIENAVRGLDGIKKMEATASEGAGTVLLTLMEGANREQVLGDVKNAIDRIETFPVEAEKPLITIPSEVEKVLSLVVYGEQPSLWLRKAAEHIRDDLRTEMGLTKVELLSPPAPEISIEISEETLRSYGISLEDVATRIQRASLDLPAGTLYTPEADIAVRTNQRREWSNEFANIVISETDSGLPLTLSDIASLSDGFGNTPIEAWYNGKPAIQIDVFAVGDETPISVEEAVQSWLSTAAQNYQGVTIEIFENDAQTYRERLYLLIDNALMGLLLVILILALFLTPRLAFWVMMSIPTALLGGMLILPLFDASINMISLFAYILVIGVVVDDAILLGESIHSYREKGMDSMSAAVAGVKAMSAPVLLAVVTTIIAFMPMFFVPGTLGELFRQISAVVVAVLIVSTIETFLILSVHLAEKHKDPAWLRVLARPQHRVNAALERFTHGGFRRAIKTAILHPIYVLCLGGTLMLITLGAVAGGLLGFSFTPSIQSDTVIAQATLPYGTPRAQSMTIQQKLVEDATLILEESGMKSPGIFSLIGARLDEGEVDAETLAGSHYISVLMRLPPVQDRVMSGQEFAQRWQQRFGDPGGIEAVSFTGETNVTGGEPIRMEISHPEDKTAREAALKLGERMRITAGLTTVDDSLRAGKPELTISLKEHAVHMGLSAEDIAQQIRHRLYGAEALRIARDGNDVKVMVRLPYAERAERGALENALIQTPDGRLVPLTEVASITKGQSVTTLSRRDGTRIYPVTADVMIGLDEDVVEDTIEDSMVPQLHAEYPGITIGFGGEEEEIDDSLAALGYGFLVVLGTIYVLLALQFNSYTQPLLLLSVIPFSFVGAIWGHILLGYDVSIISIIGMIALAGVIINNSIVLLEAYHALRKDGMAHARAITEASCSRLRPILLTTLTTCIGLAPLMLETSEQAQFLIPISVSLSFGLMFGGFVSLFMVPSLLKLFARNSAPKRYAFI